MSRTVAFNHAAQVDRFYDELLNGAIGGVRARPALTTDVHELYCLWCDRLEAPVLRAIPHFVKLLVTRHPVHLVRKRYAMGMSVLGPHGVLLLAPVSQAPSGYEADWLGVHVAAFRAGVASYKACVRVRDAACAL